MTKMRIRYRHLQVGWGWLTLASNPEGTRVGWAWCSPHDQFTRAKGRLIAAGRLAKVPLHVPALLIGERSWLITTLQQLFAEVREVADVRGVHRRESVAPGWAQRARSMGLGVTTHGGRPIMTAHRITCVALGFLLACEADPQETIAWLGESGTTGDVAASTTAAEDLPADTDSGSDPIATDSGMPETTTGWTSESGPGTTSAGATTSSGTSSSEGGSSDTPDATASTETQTTTGGTESASSTEEPTTTSAGGYCGDGVADPGEQCDGDDLRGSECSDFENAYSYRFTGGTLSCSAGCELVTATCEFCGGLYLGDFDCSPECRQGLSVYDSAVEDYGGPDAIKCVEENALFGGTPTMSGAPISSLSPFDSITYVGGAFVVYDTTSIVSVGDFSDLVLAGTLLRVTDNAVLSECQAELLRDWVIANGFTGAVQISGNVPCP